MTAKEIIERLKYLIASNKGFNREHRDEALRLVDSIPIKECEEKPTPAEGLEEEMDKFFETMPVLEHENIFEDTFKNIARHFAQWGAEHLKK